MQRQSTLFIRGGSTIDIEAINAETNGIVGIARCIMGNPFSSTSDLQVCSVFTSFMKFGIYLQKNREDRLLYSFLVKIEHYYECYMFLRATCKGNKLNLLNSTWKMVKVDLILSMLITPHAMTLKVGAPVMLLWNLSAGPGYGLCNGTRMIVLTLGQRVAEVEMSSGVNRGNCILIPHITIAPSDTELPFKLKHHQFPLQSCFAMSTNKAQGQTLQFVGIYLADHVFTHGQLYVAFSRVTDPSALTVYLNNPDGFTRNIVFQEVLWLSMYTLSRTMRSLCPPDLSCEARVGH